MMALFGTNGVRGRIGELTPGLAFDLAGGFSEFCGHGKVAVAHDMRLTSPLLYASAMSGLAAAGSDVVDLGLCSSPVAEFYHGKIGTRGLIIVTASHNPPEWNALKFVDGHGVAISMERGAKIERIALGQKTKAAKYDAVGKAAHDTMAQSVHARQALSCVDAAGIKRRKLRLALDFGNGTSALSQGLFSELGCEIVPLNQKLDGSFPGRPSEPSEENTRALCKAVREQSCDFGVAWDGDSDRVVFVDHKGEWIVGDRGFAISAMRACEEKKGMAHKVVVTTVATSRAVEECCAKWGATTEYTKVGAPYLSEKMASLGKRAVSGGEEVGGIIWPDFSPAKDGIFAAAKMCEMVCERALCDIVSQLPAYHNAKAKPAVSGPQAKAAGLSAAKKHAEGLGGKLMLIDGVRVDLEDGWAIIRASGTENAMRIFAEAKTKRRAEALMNEFKEIVEQAVQE